MIQYKQNTMDTVIDELTTMVQRYSVTLEERFDKGDDNAANMNLHFSLNDKIISIIVQKVFEQGKPYPAKDSSTLPIISPSYIASTYYSENRSLINRLINDYLAAELLEYNITR